MNGLRATVLLAALLGACSQAAGGRGAANTPPREVRLVEVGTSPLPTKVAVSGTLAPQEELVVALEVAGRLQTLAVDVGDRVEAGQVVAALAPREFELAVARAEAAMAAAETRLGEIPGGDLDRVDPEALPAVREAKALVVEATLRRERVARLVQQSLQSAAELEPAEAALAVAESRLQRARDEVRTHLAEARLARVEVQQAQKRLADGVVKAPWAGTVAGRHVVAGQVLAAGAPVVTLLRTDPLRLRLRVPDRLAAGVQTGQLVEFSVDGGDAAVRTGRIVRAGPAIERDDRTRLVEAEVANPDGALLPGAFCRARIVVAEAVPVVVVPRSAVVTFAGVDRVFTVEKDKDGVARAKGRIVELGRADGEQVEVVRGLAAGTRIVQVASGLAPELPVAAVE